jgi:hypothetical protein
LASPPGVLIAINQSSYCPAGVPATAGRRPISGQLSAMSHQPTTLSYRLAARSVSYSLTTSICLSITLPVKRLIARRTR